MATNSQKRVQNISPTTIRTDPAAIKPNAGASSGVNSNVAPVSSTGTNVIRRNRRLIHVASSVRAPDANSPISEWSLLPEGILPGEVQAPSEPKPESKTEKKAEEVQLGNLIHFPKHFVQQTHEFEYAQFFARDGKKIAFEDRHIMTVKANYRHWTFAYTDKNGTKGTGTIFVQGDDFAVWQKFSAKIRVVSDGEKDHDYIKVDDDFQYGQNKDGSMRFLVFHDKRNTPYQHRFRSGKAWKFMQWAHKRPIKYLDFLYGFVDESGDALGQEILKNALEIGKDAAGGLLTFLPYAYHGDPLRDFNAGEPLWFDPTREAVDYNDAIKVDFSKESTPVFVGDSSAPGRSSNAFLFLRPSALSHLKAKLKDGTFTVDENFHFDQLNGIPAQRIIVYEPEGSVYPTSCFSYALNRLSWDQNNVENAAAAAENARRIANEAKEVATRALEAAKRAGKNDLAATDAAEAAAEASEARELEATIAQKKFAKADKEAKAVIQAREARKAKAQKTAKVGPAPSPTVPTEAEQLRTVATHVVHEKAEPLPLFQPGGVRVGDTIKVARPAAFTKLAISDDTDSTDYVVLDFENTDPHRKPTSHVLVEEALVEKFLGLRDDKDVLKVEPHFKLYNWKFKDSERIIVYREGKSYGQAVYLTALKTHLHAQAEANPAGEGQKPKDARQNANFTQSRPIIAGSNPGTLLGKSPLKKGLPSQMVREGIPTGNQS